MNIVENMPSSSSCILVADDDQAIRECLMEAIDLLGYVVCSARNGTEALDLFRERNPMMVLTDIRMPEGDGFNLTQNVKRLREECPVVVMTGFGDAATAISALKAGACDFIQKPFELSEIKETINRIMALIRSKGMDSRSLLNIETMRWELRLENDLIGLSGIIPFMLRPICARLAPVPSMHVQMALQELLANAIEHGNLGITAEEKHDAILADVYDALLDSRRYDPKLMKRRVLVSMENDTLSGMFRCRIADEGNGFDWQKFLQTRQVLPPTIMGSGRGIFLVKSLWPEVQYHGRGNEVTLVVRYTPVEPSVQPVETSSTGLVSDERLGP